MAAIHRPLGEVACAFAAILMVLCVLRLVTGFQAVAPFDEEGTAIDLAPAEHWYDVAAPTSPEQLATVRIRITGVTLGKQHTWDADITVVPTDLLYTKLVDPRNQNQPVYVNRQLPEAYQTLEMPLRLNALTRGSGAIPTIPIRLVDLVKGVSRHVTLPMDGTPDTFPLDTYDYSAWVDLGVPGPLAVLRDASSAYVYDVPIRVRMAYVGERSSDVKLTLYQTKDLDIFQPKVTFTVTRSVLSILANLGLATLPIGFVPLALMAAIRPRRTLVPTDILAMVAGIGAAVLAVLPLRTVLVPSDFSETTIIDRVLAFDVAALFLTGSVIITWLILREPGGGQ